MHGMKSKLLALFCAALILSPHAFAADDRTDYYRGLELYHSGNFEAAVNAFGSQIQKTPDDISVKKWLDLSQKRLAQDAPVAPNADRFASDANPAAPRADLEPTPSSAGGNLYEKGISLYLNGNYTDSLAAFHTFLKANPNHVATQQWIALVRDLLPSTRSQMPRPEFVAPKKSDPPVALQPAVKSTPAPAPAPTPKPAPVFTKPAVSKPEPVPTIPAISTGSSSREKQLEAANAELQQKLKKSEEMTRRAIEQTKKALALPQPSFQSYEADSFQKKLANQVSELRAREEDLLAEIDRLRSRKTDDGGASARAVTDLEKKISSLQTELDRVKAALRVSEEAKASALRQQTESEGARREASSTIEALRKSNADLGTQFQQIKTKLAEAERALAQATSQLQAAQDARSASEQNEEKAVQELQSLRNSQTNLGPALEEKKAELAKARKQLASFDLLLEESRAQGLQLVMDAQKERQKREAAEQYYRSEENRLKAEILALKQKLSSVLPQLEAVQSSLDGLDSASR